jgi:hypothetical protein
VLVDARRKEVASYVLETLTGMEDLEFVIAAGANAR